MQYDVFISYRWVDPDMTWVRTCLRPALEAAGCKVCLDVADFVPGRNLILEMTRAGQESEHAICVLSPDYFPSNRFVHFEALMMRARDPSGNDGRLIPFVLRKCRIAEWMRDLVPVDWTNEDNLQDEWRKLLRALDAPNFAAPRPPSLFSVAESVGITIPLFDAEAVATILSGIGNPLKKRYVLPYLEDGLLRRDPTERHWIYAALGQIGGEQAVFLLTKGLADTEEFAREGAREALERLKISPIETCSPNQKPKAAYENS